MVEDTGRLRKGQSARDAGTCKGGGPASQRGTGSYLVINFIRGCGGVGKDGF